MNNVLYKIYSFLGFTRRERNASLFVIVLIVVVLLVRYLTIPESLVPIDRTEELTFLSVADSAFIPVDNIVFQPVDPNASDFEGLIKAGFTDRQASTLIKYRERGGVFHSSSDILKIYGVEQSDLKRILPNLIFPVRVVVDRPSADEQSAAWVKPEKEVSMIDINQADSSDLLYLRGIGPVLSGRIIKYRTMLGGYVKIEQLMEVYGLSDTTFTLISGMLSANPADAVRLDLNTSTFRQLLAHPYIDYDEAAAIIRLRESTGKIESIETIRINRIFKGEKLPSVLPYIMVGSDR